MTLLVGVSLIRRSPRLNVHTTIPAVSGLQHVVLRPLVLEGVETVMEDTPQRYPPIYPGGDELNLCKSRVPALHTVPNHPHRSSSIPHRLCAALEEKANASTPRVTSGYA